MVRGSSLVVRGGVTRAVQLLAVQHLALLSENCCCICSGILKSQVAQRDLLKESKNVTLCPLTAWQTSMTQGSLAAAARKAVSRQSKQVNSYLSFTGFLTKGS